MSLRKFLHRFRREPRIVEVPFYIALPELLAEARMLLSQHPNRGVQAEHFARIKLENAVQKAERFIDNHGRDVERALKEFRRVLT